MGAGKSPESAPAIPMNVHGTLEHSFARCNILYGRIDVDDQERGVARVGVCRVQKAGNLEPPPFLQARHIALNGQFSLSIISSPLLVFKALRADKRERLAAGCKPHTATSAHIPKMLHQNH
jgi:hypothetical protein